MSEKDFIEEVWKPVVGYEGLYDVSNFGRVRSLNYRGTGRVQVLKLSYDRDGYLIVSLSKNGKKISYRVHRLVWTAFNGEIQNGYELDHINTIRNDNRLENLRCCTPKENTHNPITYNRYLEAMKKRSLDADWRMNQASAVRKVWEDPEHNKNHAEAVRKARSKQVVQIDPDTGVPIRRWNCVRDVERELGIEHSNISTCCSGKCKTAGGYKWRFYTPPAVIYQPEFMKYFES